MTTIHNHPPRCCCEIPDGHAIADLRDGTPGPNDRCPLCPEHGDLAQLDESDTTTVIRFDGVTDEIPGECPICHSLIGKQHTDYCRFTGVVSMSARLPQSIAAHFVTHVIQPATTTSQPDTHTRSLHVDPNPHRRAECSPLLCGLEPPRRSQHIPVHWTDEWTTHPITDCSPDLCGEPTYEPTPPQTPTPRHCICGNDYNDTPAPGCCPVPQRHDHPR